MLINSKNVVNYFNAKYKKENVEIGTIKDLEFFFPEVTVRGLNANWITGANGEKAMLDVAALDTNVKLTNAIAIEKMQADIPYFKNSTILTEFLRQELNTAEKTGDAEYIAQVTGNILDGFTRLIKNAHFTAEKLRAEVLETGKLTLVGDSNYYTYDYNRANADITATAGSNEIVTKIKKQMETIESACGVEPEVAIVTPKAVKVLSTAPEVLGMLGNSKTLATKMDIQAFLYNTLNLETVFINNNKLFAKASVILCPKETLGTTQFGTTPAHVAVENADPKIDASLVDGKVAVQIVEKTDPIQVEEIVSAAIIPAFSKVNATGVVTLS